MAAQRGFSPIASLREGASLPPSLSASFPPGLSLFLSLIVGGNRSPPLPASAYTHTHTLDSKAGSASDNGGSPYRTAAERGVQLGHVLVYWKRGLHTPDDKHTHTGRWLLCSGDTDAGRLEAAPMGRLGLCGTVPQWRKATVCTVVKSLDGQLPAASWLCLGQPQISSCCL